MIDTLSPSIGSLSALVILRNTDDWQALFKDGQLVKQAHEIVPADLAKHCPIASIRYEDISLEGCRWLDNHGSFDNDMDLEAARNVGRE